MTRFNPRQQQGLVLLLGAVLLLQAVRLLPWPAPPKARPPLSRTGQDAQPLGDPPPSQSARYLSGYPLDLNRAGPDELTLLPGIGPKRAAAIIALRAERGGIGSLDELGRLLGLGPGLIESLGRTAWCGPLPKP